VIDPPAATEISNDNRRRPVWQWPDCPECRLDRFVCHSGGNVSSAPYQCANPFCEVESFDDARWSEVARAD
jgi:hypothetical protein